MENSHIPNSNISPRSKKIRKASKELPETPKKPSMTKDEQRTFINELLKRLTHSFQEQGELQKDEIFSVADLGRIQTKHKPIYDECLTPVIEKHGKSCGLTMAKWRSKVTEWVKNLDKPDQRGGRLIPQKHDEVFQERVLAILATMEIRTYDESTRKRFIEAAQDLREEADLEEEKDDSFSSNWWFTYREKRPKIQEVWDALPLERTFDKQQREILSSMEKILSHLPEISKISAKNVDYFIEELVKPGQIHFCYQDLILDPITDRVSSLEEDL